MLLVVGCKGAYLAFQEAQLRQLSFYDSVPLNFATCRADSVVAVYKTSFRDQYIESAKTAAIVSLNDETPAKKITTLPPPEGYRETLYLIRLHTHEDCEDSWVYFSAWYRMGQEQPYGFGPAYYGMSDSPISAIYFSRRLTVTSSLGSYKLSPGSACNFHFTVQGADTNNVSITGIIGMEANKYGGSQSFIFTISEHLPDGLPSLNFRRVHF